LVSFWYWPFPRHNPITHWMTLINSLGSGEVKIFAHSKLT